MTPEEALEQTRVMMLNALEHALRFDNAILHRVASAWLATFATRDCTAIDLSRRTDDLALDQARRLVLSASGPYVVTDPNASASPPSMPRIASRRASPPPIGWGARHFAPEEPQARPPGGRKHG